VLVQKPSQSLLLKPLAPLAHDPASTPYLPGHRRHRHAGSEQQDRSRPDDRSMWSEQRPVEAFELLSLLAIQFDAKIGRPHAHPVHDGCRLGQVPS